MQVLHSRPCRRGEEHSIQILDITSVVHCNVYMTLICVIFCAQNELILVGVLDVLFDTVSTLLRGQVSYFNFECMHIISCLFLSHL